LTAVLGENAARELEDRPLDVGEWATVVAVALTSVARD
jgi:hypothetical protein